MSKALDPYYNRKPVPDSLINDVGLSGLSAEEEHFVREKKFTANGTDVRRFSKGSKNSFQPLDDPYYGRRKVSNAEIVGVGDTGLSKEEEYQNRERKYSVGGMDVRRFSKGGKNSLQPSTDPYYARKMISSAETDGVGQLDDTLSPAEQFEVRERKQSMFQLSGDPFAELSGRGHRQSVSGDVVGASTAATTRRRSSAVAPDAAHAAAGHHHSGYDGNKLEPIVSRADGPPQLPHPTHSHNGESSTSASNHDSIDPVGGEHTRIYDAVTSGHQHPHHDDPDSVAPHEVR